ncbi:hypothetical protein CJO94_01270 [Ralstonia solanacearum]|nr:hypothetical protein CJO94_01270 [Ralstonia solanacearum]
MAAGVVCAAAGWFRHRLLWVLLPLAALFFVSLLLEIHAPDVGAALYREQGGAYYAQAYLAFGLVLLGAGSVGAGIGVANRNRTHRPPVAFQSAPDRRDDTLQRT